MSSKLFNPSWRLTLRAIAVLSWIVGIAWFIVNPDFEPLLALLGGLAALLSSYAVSDEPIGAAKPTSPSPAQDRHNRQAMLTLVETFWIKGVLEQSLHGAAMLELGLQPQPDAVRHPWDTILQLPGQPERPLPPGTRLSDVFDEAGGTLLILGQPGSGKTTMLLDLARQTIDHARRDPTQPLPTVLNLASWAAKRLPLANWLVEELNARYNLPKRVAQGWVDDDRLLLLLDGLDEVAAEHRAACVEAINTYRCDHGLVPLAICSRTQDYRDLTARLNLHGAVCIQPLTPAQIDAYLDGAGVELAAVRATLRADPTLQELAQTPLMLSLMVLAYRSHSAADLLALPTPEARRAHIFDNYIEAMFARRSPEIPYSKAQTIGWLAWLAHMLTHHNQTLFMLEDLQPGWLQTKAQRRAYRLTVGLIFGLMSGLIFGLGYGLIFGLSNGLIFGLLGGLISGGQADVRPTDTLTWHWQKAKFGLIVGLPSGVIFGLLGGLLVGLQGGLFFGLYFGLVVGLSGSAAIETRTTPNQGVWRALKNGLSIGLIAGLPVGSIFGRSFGLRAGLVGGVCVGLGAGLAGGSIDTFIQHFTLRFILRHDGYMPWRYVPFLDYAAERIFLRKVGPGYIFIHRLLLEYFAELDPIKTE